MPGSSRYFQVTVAMAATLWLLIEARSVLEPVLLALFIWFLISVTARQFSKAYASCGIQSDGLSKLSAALSILIALIVIGSMVADSARTVAEKLPLYEAKLDAIATSASSMLGVEGALKIGDVLQKIELAPAVISFAGSAANAATSMIIIFVYIIFINQEAKLAEIKLQSLSRHGIDHDQVQRASEQILREIETYIGIKVLLGLVQAVPTFVVLSFVGVEAPVFWAVMIFLFSFIPTIGTLVGIVFPLLMTLVQFESFTPLLVVAATLVPIQLLASNFLEPKLMSTSLNLSPFVVFFGIFAGGAVWGIVGALIIVPLLATAMIVFARIPSMQPVAILLSGDGRLPEH
ncbi:MAG: AI-2E family transporter [Pseudomonadota bacterium]